MSIWESVGKFLLSLIQKKPEIEVTIPFDGPTKSQLKENVLQLKLVRNRLCAEGIFGEITRDGNHVCFTAEHAYDSKPKITAGTFVCKRRLSPHFGYDVFELIGIPGHDFIEIHIGNYPQKDSDGCILLGMNCVGDMVTNSKDAFQAFMASLEGVDSFELVVS